MKKLLLLLALILTITTASLNATPVSLEKKVAGLYAAFFNRAPDYQGLNYWVGEGEEAQRDGKPILAVLNTLSRGFYAHPTFQAIYGNLDDRTFVETMYRNALGREGDSQGVAYWTGVISSGDPKIRISRADWVALFVTTALESDITPENYPDLTPEQRAAAQLRKDLITNKVDAALAYIHTLGAKTNVLTDPNDPAVVNDPAYKASIRIISGVTEDPATVADVVFFLNSIKTDDEAIEAINQNWYPEGHVPAGTLGRGDKFFGIPERFNRYYTDAEYTPDRILYVRPDSDGDGSISNPMQVDRAIEQASAGTEIRFLPGEYSGCWQLDDQHSGTYNAPIVIKAEQNVVIHCCDTGRGSCFNLEYANYVAIDGFTLVGGKYGIRSVGGYAALEHQKGTAILNNTIYNQSNDPIFTGGSDWTVVEGNAAHHAGDDDGHGIYLSNGGDWMLVRNNDLYSNSSSDFQINADPISTCQDEGIDYNDSRCDGSALDGLGRGISEFVLVEDNYFHNSEVGPNFTSVRNSVIRNNIIGFYNRHNTSFWQETDNPKLGSSNNTIEHNLFFGNNTRHVLQFINHSGHNNIRNNILLGVSLSGGTFVANSSTLLIEQDASTQGSNIFEGNYFAGGYFEYYALDGTNQHNESFDMNWFAGLPTDGMGDINSYKPTNSAPFLASGQLQATSPADIAGRPRTSPVDLGPWNLDTNTTEDNNSVDDNHTQYVTYMLNSQANVIEAKGNGQVTDISAYLDTLYSGNDSWVNISPNGEWLLMESSRIDSACEAWSCLIYGKRDLSEFSVIKMDDGNVIHPEGFSAISNDGNLIVSHMISNNRNDLFVSRKSGSGWSTPQSITFSSPSNDNRLPAISENGKEVLFDCGENICIVDINGSNLETLIRLSDKPGGSWMQIRNADFDPVGNIVFEAEDDAERIWKYDKATLELSVIDYGKTNDNSPCVLSDGRIASLWLNRPGNTDGLHELKITNTMEADYFMLIENENISDFGMGCGGL